MKQRLWVSFAAIATFAAVGSIGCNGDSETTDAGGGASGCFTGDLSQNPEMMVIHRTASGSVEATLAEGTVPILEPPQGGRVIFLGARARNLDGCPIKISSTLVDQCDGRTLATESRDIIMKPNGSGWLE